MDAIVDDIKKIVKKKYGLLSLDNLLELIPIIKGKVQDKGIKDDKAYKWPGPKDVRTKMEKEFTRKYPYVPCKVSSPPVISLSANSADSIPDLEAKPSSTLTIRAPAMLG